MSASNAISSSRKAPSGAPPRNGASSSSTERFSLGGPSLRLDPRIHAYRRDIADVALAGQLFAPHYARPTVRACGLSPRPLRSGPSDSAPAVSELLPGEEFAVVDVTAGWAWGYCRADHRVGYVEAIELVAPGQPTHVVIEASAPVEAGADLLSPTLTGLPMGSRLSGEVQGALLRIEAGFVPLSYLRRVGHYEEDPVAVAQRLLGAPYRPGGRTVQGIDGPGLVQLALRQCGTPAPREADLQTALGEPIADGTTLRRGDLVFCAGAPGLMVDDQLVIHVTPDTGKVCVEPLRCLPSEGLQRRRLV